MKEAAASINLIKPLGTTWQLKSWRHQGDLHHHLQETVDGHAALRIRLRTPLRMISGLQFQMQLHRPYLLNIGYMLLYMLGIDVRGLKLSCYFESICDTVSLLQIVCLPPV